MKHDQFGFGFHESASPITTKVIRRCFEDHKALKVGKYEIYGGSCSHPIVKDADIYVGFDHSMSFRGGNYPWEDGDEFLYPITDMAAPKDADSFMKLIEYLKQCLCIGKKVHIGCIGGHGRTGTVMAALVAHMTGEKDATTYVREHYCKKAVESKSQIAFLKKHFGITPAKPTKDYAPSMWKSARKSDDFYSGKKKAKGKIARANKKEFVVSPMGANDIWGTYLDNEI
jgi:hypothetical protein